MQGTTGWSRCPGRGAGAKSQARTSDSASWTAGDPQPLWVCGGENGQEPATHPRLMTESGNLCRPCLGLRCRVLLGEVTSVRKVLFFLKKKKPQNPSPLQDSSCQTHSAAAESDVDAAICRPCLHFHRPVTRHFRGTLFLQ